MEIRAGFEPATNRFAVCPLEPLEYRIMAGIAGLEPTMVKPADLQSAAIAARRLTHMAERAELESDTQRVRLA